MTSGLAAVTGATGFLGQHVVRALADAGWRIRLLARRPPFSLFWDGLEPEVTPGGLDDPAALARLCTGADFVVHGAGLIAGSPRELARVNIEGARRLAQAAAAAPAATVVLVSSLAAREPHLSAYAATKRAGEDAAREVLGARLRVARPPAIYGPGDRETLKVFKAAQLSPVLPVLRPAARVALIHVADAARQIVAMANAAAPCGPVALSDARPEGYSWRELMQTAASVLGHRRPMVQIPAAVLYGLAAADCAGNGWRRTTATLTFGKVRELTHLDWGIRPNESAREAPLAQFDLRGGFQHTVDWYRKNGWL